MGKAMASHAGVDSALASIVAASQAAADKAGQAHAKAVQRVAVLMAAGVSVAAVRDGITRNSALAEVGVKGSYAQFFPLIAEAVKLDGAPARIFGTDGIAPAIATRQQAAVKAGAGKGWTDRARAALADVSSWDALLALLLTPAEAEAAEAAKAEAAEARAAAKAAKADGAAVPVDLSEGLGEFLLMLTTVDPASLSADVRKQLASVSKACGQLAKGERASL